jgi:hypothetical protein
MAHSKRGWKIVGWKREDLIRLLKDRGNLPLDVRAEAIAEAVLDPGSGIEDDRASLLVEESRPRGL